LIRIRACYPVAKVPHKEYFSVTLSNLYRSLKNNILQWIRIFRVMKYATKERRLSK